MVRALTAEEKKLAQAAKDKANPAIKARRKQVASMIGPHGGARPVADWVAERNRLEAERDALKPITGHPAIVLQGGRAVTVRYDLIRRFTQRLKPSEWQVTVKVVQVLNASHVLVEYADHSERRRGRVIFKELPTYQRLALDDMPLPTVDLTGLDIVSLPPKTIAALERIALGGERPERSARTASASRSA